MHFSNRGRVYQRIEEYDKAKEFAKRNYEDNPDSTFTPLPRNITPLGIELDPTTAADLSNTDK